MGVDREPLGLMSIEQAREAAVAADVDLVLIASDAVPPVCRLIEYSKYKYEHEKQKKDTLKKQRENA